MITNRFPSLSAGKSDAENKKLATDLTHAGDDSLSRIEALEHNVARLSLLSEALWQVLQEKSPKTSADLSRYVDAVVQQRKNRSEQKLRCLICNHSSPAVKAACIYCGGKLEGQAEIAVFPV